ncbi:RNA polymerase sigma factor [Kineosporia succinea]|uniref:RNA polymerase sigma factor (Sigma-70 family) n=1 Tax=Kineosporia succinea TaxID=84632 RepID=A0ABT9P6F5_9ACTN|nr:sigma-70 family RNA polymerase sigma factor [Kineosporia succinea]MDP9828014.1 RNA polymerase sigma factor (sigma-70 family) [Kineosporia succinea]
MPSPHALIEGVFRVEATRIVASVARMVRDVGVAEEIAQDALVTALEQWPVKGTPDNPAAWLMTTARNRAIDRIRREARLAENLVELGHRLPSDVVPEIDTIEDDVLRLVFVTCHPVLAPQNRVALALRLLGGLTTAEIARAYLVPEATVAQRITRAKRTLAEKKVPFEVPAGDERPARLASVLEVVYLIFNEGYSASSGDDLLRPALCHDALHLGRTLAALMPAEPEVHGLLALLELQASRLRARTGDDSAPVPLDRQNRARWDQWLIRRGLAGLEKAQGLGGTFGPYTLQAAIAAEHARARTPDDTDWMRIAALYQVLLGALPTPVVALNRAVALGRALGPQAGLDAADALAGEPALRTYPLLPGVRADLLARLGRIDEARAEFERAAAMTGNVSEREALLSRARELP